LQYVEVNYLTAGRTVKSSKLSAAASAVLPAAAGVTLVAATNPFDAWST
jgi:hypothetical protein